MAALCLVGCLGGNVGRTQKVYDGEQRRVVIVGGGFAAVHMCEELAKHPHNIKVTMICPNDHLDIAWASPRAIARPETANRNVIPLHKIFQRSKHAHDMVTHVHDTVAWVTETYVETAMSCERHEYDVLVIGTGATYAEGSEAKRLKSNHSSIGGADRVKELRELAERVKGSKGVMVVGAGPTGIELAAELGAAYPHVPIKLVTNKYEVGAGMPKAGESRASSRVSIPAQRVVRHGRTWVDTGLETARVRRRVHVRRDGAQHELPRRRRVEGEFRREGVHQDGCHRSGAGTFIWF